MDKDIKKLKSDLEKRRQFDVSFCAVQKILYERMESHHMKFSNENYQITKILYDQARNKVLSVNDYASLFSGMLDAGEFLGSAPARVDDCVTRKSLIDLRGMEFQHRPPFWGVIFRDFDFSFSKTDTISCFTHCKLIECVFNNVIYAYSYLDIYFNKCRFSFADLQKCWAVESCFDQCNFDKCKMGGIQMHDSLVVDCVFTQCDFRKAEMSGRFWNCTFENCKFRQAFMHLAEYKNCKFINCDFKNTWEDFVPPGVIE